MKKIYVLVLITVMDRAGAETMMMNYLRNIDREKIQMDFLINRKERADYEEEIEKLGSHIYRMCPLYPGKFRKYRAELRTFLREHRQYTIIHSNLEERSCIALKIAKQMGIPIRIVHAHSVPKRFDAKMPVRIYFRNRLKGKYTHRIACSEVPAQWLYGTTDNVYYMKNAINAEEFSFNECERKKARKQLKLKENTLVIGHIGRFTYEKNHEFLIDIFNNVNRQHPNSELLLIGGGKPQEEVETKEKIKKKVKELGLKSKVKFLGIREDISSLMQAMDLMVMPSISEGFPVTLIEAQGVGLKCLVSDVVPYSCNVTEEMQYMSIKQEPVEWADKILSWYGECKEGDITNRKLSAKTMNDSIRTAGYDIRENAKWLEDFYRNAQANILIEETGENNENS